MEMGLRRRPELDRAASRPSLCHARQVRRPPDGQRARRKRAPFPGVGRVVRGRPEEMIARRTMLGRFVALLAMGGAWSALFAKASPKMFDVHDFGAVGNGRTVDTA